MKCGDTGTILVPGLSITTFSGCARNWKQSLLIPSTFIPSIALVTSSCPRSLYSILHQEKLKRGPCANRLSEALSLRLNIVLTRNPSNQFAKRSCKTSKSMRAMRVARRMSQFFSIVILLLTCGALSESHTVEVAGARHSVYISHPKEVADVIEGAAGAVSK
jgi:hypothetical protein